MGLFKKNFFSTDGKAVKVPQGLWVKCDSCAEIIYKKEVETNLEVCPKCNYHFRIPARVRIGMLADEESFEEFDVGLEPKDALDFKDLKKYKAKIKAYHKKTGLNDSVVCGAASIGGNRVLMAAFDFFYMGGSMGSVAGEKVTRTLERAVKEGCGAVIISSSGGARMQEGILSLMQMAKTAAAAARLKEAGFPFISILTDPTTGGVTASFAMLGDVIIAEPRALIGFAGPRVIAETIRQTLPEGFQRAEYLLEHGMIDMIEERKNLRESISNILAMLG